MSELKSILNSIDPEVQENTQDGFYNVPSYDYVYDVQSQQVKKKNIMSMFEPGGFYADPTGDRTQKYIKERYINAPTKITKNIATETSLVVQDTLDTIAEEFTDFGDNVLFYTNKYNPAHTLGEYPLPDAKNIFYDEKQGKGNIRSAWDFYRTGNGLIEVQEPTETKEQYKERQANNPNKFYLQEPQTFVGDLAADIGAFLVPFIYGTKIVQTPQMISSGRKYLDRAFRWAVSGAGVEFVYGTESKEDESFLGMFTGFSPTTQTGLKNLMHNSFLNDDDAEQFANHLDHAVNSGIDEGLLSLAFSGIGHIFKSSYFKMFPDEAVKSAKKSWQRDHAIPFSKYAERNPGITNKDTLAKYMKQPKVKTWFTDESRRFFFQTKNVDDFIKQFEAEVFGPVQIGKGAYNNGFDVFSNGYSTYKKNIVKLYKRMQANKINGLKIFLAGGAAYTAMSSSDAEAGILNKSIQKYFQKGGQKLFQRGADNKLIPITHDDVLAMPVAKEIFIQSQEAEGEWIVHQNKDEYLASEDGYDANPLDLLPNQKYPYYDLLAQKIQGMNFDTMPKEQFLNTITNTPGIKKEEIETTELVEFVNGVDGDVISKNALLTDWYDNSRITLTTRTFGSDTGSGEMEEAYGKYEEQTMPGNYDKYKEHILKFNKELSEPDLLKLSESMITAADLKLTYNIGNKINSNGDRVSSEYVNLVDKDGKYINELHGTPINVPADRPEEFEKFKKERERTLFNGLITIYNQNLKRAFMKDKTFQSSHFSESNVLLHTRTNERIASDGQPLLFLEELQSDWHQMGRREGYFKPGRTPITSAINSAIKSGVLDAPFKDTNSWTQLGLKKMVNYAATKGYTRLAWTPGAVQNERYKLSAYFDSMFVEKIKGGTKEGQYYISGSDKKGYGDIDRTVNESELPNTVGKEFAQKIVDEAATYPDGHTYKGLDLEIGGKGMINYYDKMIPNNLKKLYAKDGVEFGEIELGNQKLGTYAMNENFSAPAAPNNFVYEILEDLGLGYGHSRIELNTIVMNDEVLYNDFREFLVQVVDDMLSIDTTGNLVKSIDVDTIIENLSTVEQEAFFDEWLATYGIEPAVNNITVQYMTIPENLKDRVLKLGQPLFGSNPSKLGAYENKTTQ